MKRFVLSIIAAINKCVNIVQIKRKNVAYKSFPVINGILFITGHGKMSLGKDVHFNSSRRSNPIGGDNKLIIDLGTVGHLEIDDHSGISNATIIAHDKITIGKNVKIGGSVKLYSTDFHSLDSEKRKHSETDIAATKPIQIFDNAFIGAHSIVLKGVTIGENSIIGAGSVVTKSVPPNQIWGGNPAKFIKDV